MPTENSFDKKTLYKEQRYWYHLSTTLKKKIEKLIPWGNRDGINRPDNEPDVKRICVAPSLAHCLTALPYSSGDAFYVYRTKDMVIANKPHGVHDISATLEGWLENPTIFIKLGVLDLSDIEKKENIEIIDTAAIEIDVKLSKKVINWWRKIDIEKYVKPSLTSFRSYL